MVKIYKGYHIMNSLLVDLCHGEARICIDNEINVNCTKNAVLNIKN